MDWPKVVLIEIVALFVLALVSILVRTGRRPLLDLWPTGCSEAPSREDQGVVGTNVTTLI